MSDESLAQASWPSAVLSEQSLYPSLSRSLCLYLSIYISIDPSLKWLQYRASNAMLSFYILTAIFRRKASNKRHFGEFSDV